MQSARGLSLYTSTSIDGKYYTGRGNGGPAHDPGSPTEQVDVLQALESLMEWEPNPLLEEPQVGRLDLFGSMIN